MNQHLPMYTITHSTTEISSRNYIDQYRDTTRFIGYCKACDRYGRCWACPPFEFDSESYIPSDGYIYIIGTKISFTPHLISTNTDSGQCVHITTQIIKEVRVELDQKLVALEKVFPGSKAFFAGTCLLCDKEQCTRIKDQPCITPKQIRPSLEAIGFDVAKSAEELLNIPLKWGNENKFPEYITLVSGFFCNKKIPLFFLNTDLSL